MPSRLKTVLKFLFFFLCIVFFNTQLLTPALAGTGDDSLITTSNSSGLQTDSNSSVILEQDISDENVSTNSVVDQGTIISTIFTGLNFTGTESILSPATSGTDEGVPAIWQDQVVWQSVFPDPDDPQIHFSDIFLYTISTGECTRIGTNLSALAIPDIWNDRIVWSTWEDANFEIFLYNISMNKTVRITNDSVNQVKPRIWEDHIVWQQGDDSDPEMAVYLYTISTGEAIQLDAGSGFAMSPAIWEDRIVWQDGRNGNDFDIFLYNCTSGVETQITVDPAWQMNPDIWQDNIVWEDPRDSYNHIYLYDIVSGNESQVTYGENDQYNPKIYENYVVYVNQSDIYLTDLSTTNESKISSGDSESIQSNPDIWNNRITWTDNRNGDYDIFIFTIGIEMPPLLADFTQNTTQGEYPLTVAFTDISSGQIDGWHWDFGDGNGSEEQNPVYSYILPGSYSVTLNIHNPWQRNGVLKTDLISVGSVPVPQFSVNQTSGPAPLIVQFTDESSGLPNEWKWDFGDGESSSEQNPVHHYQDAGVYDVHLNVSNTYGSALLTKQEYISVMAGTYHTCILPSEGIEIKDTGSGPLLELNATLAGNYTFNPETNPGMILYIPEAESGIEQILFYSKNGTEFSYSDNDALGGPLGQATISSCNVVPGNFSQKVGDNCQFNYTADIPGYPEGTGINLIVWEGATPEDFVTFNHISSDYNYVRVEDLAYSVWFNQEVTMPDTDSATLVFGVSSDWVDQYGWRWCNSIESDPPGAAVFVDSQYIGDTPICIEEGLSPGNHTVTVKEVGYYPKTFPVTIDDKRDSIHVIRIGDDGTGEVLNTTFIGHDPERNLDFFRAESPNGLSTFGLASLSKSGNVLQLINLVISAIVSGGGGGGGGSSASASLGSVQKTTAPTPVASEPPETFSPITKEPPAPEVTSPPVDTPAAQKTAPPATGEAQGVSPLGSLIEGTSSLIILRNLSVVFVVIFVTAIFFLRWKR